MPPSDAFRSTPTPVRPPEEENELPSELYRKLVDLYAAGELPEGIEADLEQAAHGDKELAHEMLTLRSAVDQLKSTPVPEFTEESYQRILMKLYTSGAEIETKSPPPVHLQYHLPMAG